MSWFKDVLDFGQSSNDPFIKWLFKLFLLLLTSFFFVALIVISYLVLFKHYEIRWADKLFGLELHAPVPPDTLKKTDTTKKNLQVLSPVKDTTAQPFSLSNNEKLKVLAFLSKMMIGKSKSEVQVMLCAGEDKNSQHCADQLYDYFKLNGYDVALDSLSGSPQAGFTFSDLPPAGISPETIRIDIFEIDKRRECRSADSGGFGAFLLLKKANENISFDGIGTQSLHSISLIETVS